MEYAIPPFILILVLRFGFPALVTCFFEKFSEPKVESARQKNNSTAAMPIEQTNSQKTAATRKGLDELKCRLDQRKQ
ncbi:hypothetical protein [Yoonia algicola]|uniref:Uncharacterized protein n=1 Tax=Yoonia algicola TaxID=3137368 RepID=A0AAN0LZU8_9RHOB